MSNMATNIFFSVSLLSLCILLCSLKKGFAFEERETTAKNNYRQHSHIIQVSSLLPSSVCSPSTKALDEKSSLKVVHKHGPCSKLVKNNAPNHTEVLLQDQSRVDSIHSRLSKNSGRDGDAKETDAANLPAKDGQILGSGDYFVTVGLGSPKKDLSLIFDTGSALIWTQCQPCVRKCYKQQEPIFDPSASKSYSNVTCGPDECNSLASATGNSLNCSSSTCVYGIQYVDSSFSIGFFAKETLTLTSTDVFNNILFGCGQNNQGLFTGVAGLLGLGRDKLSLPSQTASKYNKLFSYCLPSSPSSTGHLTFGASLSKSVKFTPLSTISQGSSFYGLDITGISVGGQKLAISSSIFSTAGSIIDSGTVITRLPSTAYAALRTSFRQQMTQYPTAPALSILDTCYDFSQSQSQNKTVLIPVISFFFNGGVQLDIVSQGILLGDRLSQLCLAFAGNTDDRRVAILGNVQQKTLEVVYDVAGGRVGFAPGGCT